MVLYGASGHAKVIIDILEKNKINISYIIDDNTQITSLNKYIVQHNINGIGDEPLIISIGNNKIRKSISEKLKDVNFIDAIHPNAVIDKTSSISEGTVVMANVVINSTASIGKHCIINTNAVVEHDCKIENFVHISPSATLCGNVTIGEGTHIGAGATVIPNVKIGKWCTIGAASVILSDVPDHAVIYGNPGRVIKFNKDK